MPILVTGTARAWQHSSWCHNYEFCETILIECQGLYNYLGRDSATTRALIIEVRDDKGRLVRRFRPSVQVYVYFTRKPASIISELAISPSHEELHIPRNYALYLNIAVGYKVTLLLVDAEDLPLLPYEIKPLSDEAVGVLRRLPRSLRRLLKLSSLRPILRESIGYLLDAYWRLEEDYVESARTSIRKTLECLENIMCNLEVSKESAAEREVENFPERLLKPIRKLKDNN